MGNTIKRKKYLEFDTETDIVIKITFKYKNGKTKTLKYPESQEFMNRIIDGLVHSHIH